ncbi:formate dehydrogenase accessory sulfurtransferase FdhD [Candidatus Thioglobus sp.]|nr:formate dehydrogenase accessory sulfurtransferase FdhD [Candidatus Thioglobus sp.]
MVNSSCGVCGKGTLNAIEIAYEPNIDKAGPIVSIDLITELPNILRARQEQFANTGGVHASALLTEGGTPNWLRLRICLPRFTQP